jgi:sulfur-oxidizing protein SoxY
MKGIADVESRKHHFPPRSDPCGRRLCSSRAGARGGARNTRNDGPVDVRGTRRRRARSGRVKLDISPLAENGNAVPVTISVESAMTAADHVKTIYLFSPENPLPDIARFHLGPRSGQARVMTTVRLAASQRVQAVAVLSDGSVWSDSAEVIVTLSACIDAG